jgi:hypothetical protein
VSRRLDFVFDFPMSYEVVALDRIDRSGGKRAYGFPDAVLVGPQQELADRPILEVRPHRGDPWVGVFYGGSYGVPPAMRGRVISWPDEWSLCVLYAGGAVVARADEPTSTYEIECWPTTGLQVVPERGMVVFSNFDGLVAYGRDGLVWRSKRLALDDLRIEGVEGHVLHVAGFFGDGTLKRFTVDPATGEASGQPFQPN